MRIRSIKPEFWRSEDIAALPWETRLVFIGLWSYVDDNGVGRDDERIIAAELFALDESLSESSVRIHDGLIQLQTAGLIARYTVDGRRYVHITTWAKHQKINRPSPGRYPLPTCENVEIHAPFTEGSVSAHNTLSAGAVEQGSRGTGEEEICATASRESDPPGFAEFWEAYPQRRDRRKAVAAFRKALKRADAQTIIDGARRYAADPNRQEQYTKFPEGWLNGDRWSDGPLPVRNPQRPAMSRADEKAHNTMAAGARLMAARKELA